MKKRILAAILSTCICVGAASAAQTYTQNIKVTYGIDFAFNGQPVMLQDPNGNVVHPFVYNGTTYVPIRAVSETFGADVVYDASENAAYIYDDFSELCGAVHEMQNIISDCYNLVLMQIYGEPTDYTSLYNDCDQRITNFYSSLEFLSTDEGYNQNISILMDELMPNYQAFLLSFAAMQKNYTGYLISINPYTTNQLVNSMHDTIDKYYIARDTIDSFYSDYCDWRGVVYGS